MFQFAAATNSIFLGLIPLLALVFFLGWRGRTRAVETFAEPAVSPFLNSQFSQSKYWVRLSLLFFSTLFLVLTLMRPQGNPVNRVVKKRGRDLIFVIDVSRSMLAEDLYPNRLGKAKQLVSDVVDILEGDRVGLLVFAGATAIKSPLTLDYNYFKQALSSIGPEDVNRGGTHIGDAIRMVSERLFYDQDNKFRDVILITDGEDHESFPIEAAKSAAKKGIKIHTVGLGDPDGANIPIRKRGSYRLLTYNNSTVRTKLDESTLRRIAEITRGVFIPVRTNLVDLANLYKDYIVTAEKRELESKKSKLWSELFQFFLGIAILSIMVESLIGERGRKAEYRFFFKES